MNALTRIAGVARSPGDPKVVATGPSSLTGPDSLARALGWFSLGLGLTELVAARRITRALGLRGKEGLVRAYGVREIAAGIPTLSVDRQIGLASRIAGDALDLVALAPALRARNRKRRNAVVAAASVVAITILDGIALAAVRTRHRRDGARRDYRARSGLPRGIAASRGLARSDFVTPPDLRAAPDVVEALP
jgi:hypothetical protein